MNTRLAADILPLTHPGPVASQRRDVLSAPRSKTWRVPLPAATSLYDAVTRAMVCLGVRTAALDIRQAVFSHLRYFEIAAGTGEGPVARYTSALDYSGRLQLVCSGATIGRTLQGELAVHCHALTVNDVGQKIGGHLLTEHCVLAEDGVAWLLSLDPIDLVIDTDPEIGTPVFHPIYRKV